MSGEELPTDIDVLDRDVKHPAAEPDISPEALEAQKQAREAAETEAKAQQEAAEAKTAVDLAEHRGKLGLKTESDEIPKDGEAQVADLEDEPNASEGGLEAEDAISEIESVVERVKGPEDNEGHERSRDKNAPRAEGDKDSHDKGHDKHDKKGGHGGHGEPAKLRDWAISSAWVGGTAAAALGAVFFEFPALATWAGATPLITAALTGAGVGASFFILGPACYVAWTLAKNLLGALWSEKGTLIKSISSKFGSMGKGGGGSGGGAAHH